MKGFNTLHLAPSIGSLILDRRQSTVQSHPVGLQSITGVSKLNIKGLIINILGIEGHIALSQLLSLAIVVKE